MKFGPVTEGIWGKQDVAAFFEKAAAAVQEGGTEMATEEQMEYTWTRHPRSGDVYGIEIEGCSVVGIGGLSAQRFRTPGYPLIRRAVGPLHYTDPRDPDSIRGLLDSMDQETATEDARWLEAELSRRHDPR